MRPHHLTGALRLALIVGSLLFGFASPLRAQQADVSASDDRVVIAVLPFRVHSPTARDELARELPERLVDRLADAPDVDVVPPERVQRRLEETGEAGRELADDRLRSLASELGADALVSVSLTELAGRYSLDVRVTPAREAERPRTLVFTAGSLEELNASLDQAADRAVAELSEEGPAPVLGLEVAGAGDLEAELRSRIRSQVGAPYDPEQVRQDVARLEQHPEVARVSVETDRTARGLSLRFRVVRSAALFGGGTPESAGERVVAVEVRGNRRIDAEAIRARIRTRAGDPLRPAQVAADVRDVFALGFFRDVRVLTEDAEGGKVLIFDVDENPVVRQIAIVGNDNIDSDKIRDALTLTTGSTLDYPLLYENTQRIEALYRAEGYYLADVTYEIEPLAEGSVSVDFKVEEKDKLRLEEVVFEGNEHFDDDELTDDFATRTWKWYSPVTSWFDKTGTYSEPVFFRDLRTVEKKYTDAGYLQVEVGEPQVEATEEGLVVRIDVAEGPRYRVGKIDVAGDETVDLETLRRKLKLEKGEIFNRSHLTEDVESLERYYTDRGFYFASVEPATRLDQEDRTVDVEFRVEKGPLYFIRHIDIAGNTETVDKVVRREMRVTEGELYSARALQVSNRRIRGLGFFEDVAFEPQATEDPSQLDLDVNVVERPTGSFSFGAGFSSQDAFVFTASLSQANLFGRGYGANVSADIGGRTTRFFVSFNDPYFLGTDFSLGTTVFITSIRFNDFEQDQQGVEFDLGHALNEENTARGFLRYSFARRKIKQDTGVNAAAVIFRELLQGNESTSLLGLSVRSDTRDDRFAPVSGLNWGASVEYAGLGGFANFLRMEGRYAWYLGAPDWLLNRSTFVLSTRLGWAVPFNELTDFEFQGLDEVPGCDAPGACVGVAPLDQIDEDIELPLTERYFLGGIGTFQLRGFKARSVGPRRPILRRSGLFGTGELFLPVGAEIRTNPVDGSLVAVCNDQIIGGRNPNQGNGNGKCNDLSDDDIDDFEDLDETDVIGGNKFITSSLEYRFPISEEIGLQGVLFGDGGNAFAENEPMMFDPRDWRYGVGGGVLWFSPFGPLQLVLGFPLDREAAVEDTPVFEFSVGGFGL